MTAEQQAIPRRESGYSFEPDTVVVHERYQDHAPNAHRTRSMVGVLNREIQTGIKATPCPVCFPAPKRPGTVTRWQRTAPQPETVAVSLEPPVNATLETLKAESEADA